MPVGMLGRLPKREDAAKFAIAWAHEYLVAPLAAPRYPLDVRGPSAGAMWGNDAKGDCGECGILFIELATAARAGVNPLPSWTTDQAVDEYLAFTGGDDTGVVLADFLLWLYHRGRIKGFAPAPHADRATCDGLIQLTGQALYCGVNLTDNDQADFGVRPWGSEEATPDANLGHCVVKCYSDGTTVEQWRTWAAFQDATLDWGDQCLDEAWVVLTTEEQAAAFSSQLFADLDALGGTGGHRAPEAAVAGTAAASGPGGVSGAVGVEIGTAPAVAAGPDSYPPGSGVSTDENDPSQVLPASTAPAVAATPGEYEAREIDGEAETSEASA